MGPDCKRMVGCCMIQLHDSTSTRWTSWLICIGFAIGFPLYLFPPEIFDPTSIRWLLTGDLAQQFLAWHHFRDAPWTWPLGMIPGYAEAMLGSIVYADAIPLFALMFKPLSPVLPLHFQFTGFWILSCFVLQASFAWRCAWLATGRSWAALGFVMLAVWSPLLVNRGMGHFALMGHWVVLWALGNYLDSCCRGFHWRVLCLLVSSLIHAYLLLLVLAVLAAELVRRWLVLGEWSGRGVIGRATVSGVLLTLCMWAAGYFLQSNVGGGVDLLGLYSLDLNAFFNPGWSSRFLPMLPTLASSAFEGSAYLGLGVIALLVAAAGTAICDRAQVAARLRSQWPLIAAATLLLVIAIGPIVRFGGEVLFVVSLPQSLAKVLSVFRGSGRLAWLAWYGLALFAVVYMFLRLPKRTATIVVLVAVVLQCVESSLWMSQMQRQYRHLYTERELPEARPLTSEFWQLAAARYRNIAIAPLLHAAPNWIPLALLAGDNQMSINVAQFARISWPEVAPAHDALRISLAHGPLEPATIYVLNDPAMIGPNVLRQNDGIGVVDGLTVVAPGWFDGLGCCLSRPVVSSTSATGSGVE